MSQTLQREGEGKGKIHHRRHHPACVRVSAICRNIEKGGEGKSKGTLVTKTTSELVLQIQQWGSSQMMRRRATQVEQTSLWPHAP